MVNFFKERRESLGKTQSQVGQEVGLTHGAVQHWENGNSLPSPEVYDALAKSLGVRPERIANEVMKLGRLRAAAKTSV